jgi:hypothetical protein
MPVKKHRTKKSPKKGFFRPIHLQAVVFLVVYTILSKTIFIKSIASENLAVNFFSPYIFGVAAGIIFLYLLNHADFFHFIKEVEKAERKKENNYLKKYLHFGKVLSTLIIATIGGPVFAALTVRLLLNKVWYKYLLIAAGNLTSTILGVSLAKGALNFIF